MDVACDYDIFRRDLLKIYYYYRYIVTTFVTDTHLGGNHEIQQKRDQYVQPCPYHAENRKLKVFHGVKWFIYAQVDFQVPNSVVQPGLHPLSKSGVLGPPGDTFTSSTPGQVPNLSLDPTSRPGCVLAFGGPILFHLEDARKSLEDARKSRLETVKKVFRGR